MSIEKLFTTAAFASLVLSCGTSPTLVAAFSVPSYKVSTLRQWASLESIRFRELDLHKLHATPSINDDNNESSGSLKTSIPSQGTKGRRDLVIRGVSSIDRSLDGGESNESDESSSLANGPLSALGRTIAEKMGKVEDSRIAFSEISSGEVPRVFSNLSYKKEVIGGQLVSSATHASGSTFSSAALIAGTTVGAGVLALPTATAPAGFLASSGALFIAWLYMAISGLLIAELSINRIGETGRPGVGLLELYKSSLGGGLGKLGSAAYFFLHYAIMVAYFAQGGSNLGSFFDSIGLDSVASVPGLDQLLFAGSVGLFVYFCKPSVVEKVNNVLVAAVITTFVGIMGIGAGSADFQALLSPENQHPELVVSAFPILFLSLVYQNVVPTVVTQLEADRQKITTAIVGGTAAPLLMFLAWNAIILGNVLGMPVDLSEGINPIELLQSGEHGGELLSVLVGSFSELAVTTSVIGFIYGIIDGLTDVTGLPMKGPQFEKWKPALFAGTLLPPLALSLGNPDIFYQALDYGGAFGVSTLFLVLPPIMVWKERYGEDNKQLTVPPMVPFGKLPLGSLWKAAGTLIVEQGAEKLGVFDFLGGLLASSNF